MGLSSSFADLFHRDLVVPVFVLKFREGVGVWLRVFDIVQHINLLQVQVVYARVYRQPEFWVSLMKYDRAPIFPVLVHKVMPG